MHFSCLLLLSLSISSYCLETYCFSESGNQNTPSRYLFFSLISEQKAVAIAEYTAIVILLFGRWHTGVSITYENGVSIATGPSDSYPIFIKVYSYPITKGSCFNINERILHTFECLFILFLSSSLQAREYIKKRSQISLWYAYCVYILGVHTI